MAVSNGRKARPGGQRRADGWMQLAYAQLRRRRIVKPLAAIGVTMPGMVRGRSQSVARARGRERIGYGRPLLGEIVDQG